MAWIESHEELLNHPKSKRLKRKLGVSEHEVIGLLHYFWHWAVTFAEDGVITKFSAEDIADAIRFEGDAEKLLRSLIESGFVDEVDGETVIHDWFDHAGKLILWRRKEAERLRKYRSKKKDTDVIHVTNNERTPYEHSSDTVRTPEYSNSNSNSNKEDIKHIVDSDECDLAFQQFLIAYPKGSGTVKKEALKSWKKVWKIKPDVNEILSGLGRYVSHQKALGRSMCSAQVFLNQERWTESWDIEPLIKPYQNKSDEQRNEIEKLKQSILMGGTEVEENNQTRSRVDITTDQNDIPQFYLE